MAESEKQLAYSVADACKRIGIGNTTFYELVKGGQIQTIKIGRKTLVTEVELQKLIKKLTDAILVAHQEAKNAAAGT